MKKLMCIGFVLLLLLPQSIQAKEAVQKENGLELLSTYAVVYNVEDKSILFDKNAHEKMYMASMTKVMSALVAMDRVKNLDDTIIMQKEAWSMLVEENASVVNYAVGDIFTYRDLLYGTLIGSGADATKQLALSLFNGEQEMVDAMNAKVKELGLKHTQFKNVTGLDNEEHYTTAYEMAKIMEVAIANEDLKMIMGSWSYVTSNGKHTIRHTLADNEEKNIARPAYMLGGKTGFTNAAGISLVSFGIIQEELFIVVIGNAPQGNGTTIHIDESKKAYEYMDANYKRSVIVNKGQEIAKVNMDFAKESVYKVKAEKEYHLMMPKEFNKKDITWIYQGKKRLVAPQIKNEYIGSFDVLYQGVKKLEVKVKLVKNIERDQFKYIRYQVGEFIESYYLYAIGIFVALGILKYIGVKKKRV